MSDEDINWIKGLTASGSARERTSAELYSLLLAPARAEARRLSRMLNVSGPEIDDVASQAAADAIVSIIRRIPDFRGDAKFTTWAYRFVITEVTSKMHRHFWRRADAPLDVEERPEIPATREFQPEVVVESRDVLAAVSRAVDTALTDNQRSTLLATALDGMSPTELGRQHNSNRNAVHKMVFDARSKLRTALADEGYLVAATTRR